MPELLTAADAIEQIRHARLYQRGAPAKQQLTLAAAQRCHELDTGYTLREIAAATGLSKDQVHRVVGHRCCTRV